MDIETCEQAEDIIFGLISRTNGSIAEYLEATSLHIASAIDHILDGADTIDDLEGPQKTCFGVSFQNRHTRGLDLPRKISKKNNPHNLELDTKLGGIHVDIKTTLGGKTWMVPPECHGKWMLLVKVDWRVNCFSVGVLKATADHLTEGYNRDKKNSVSAAGRNDVIWIGENVAIS